MHCFLAAYMLLLPIGNWSGHLVLNPACELRESCVVEPALCYGKVRC
jgi:hypothetical protein